MSTTTNKSTSTTSTSKAVSESDHAAARAIQRYRQTIKDKKTTMVQDHDFWGLKALYMHATDLSHEVKKDILTLLSCPSNAFVVSYKRKTHGTQSYSRGHPHVNLMRTLNLWKKCGKHDDAWAIHLRSSKRALLTWSCNRRIRYAMTSRQPTVVDIDMAGAIIATSIALAVENNYQGGISHLMTLYTDRDVHLYDDIAYALRLEELLTLEKHQNDTIRSLAKLVTTTMFTSGTMFVHCDRMKPFDSKSANIIAYLKETNKQIKKLRQWALSQKSFKGLCPKTFNGERFLELARIENGLKGRECYDNIEGSAYSYLYAEMEHLVVDCGMDSLHKKTDLRANCFDGMMLCTTQPVGTIKVHDAFKGYVRFVCKPQKLNDGADAFMAHCEKPFGALWDTNDIAWARTELESIIGLHTPLEHSWVVPAHKVITEKRPPALELSKKFLYGLRLGLGSGKTTMAIDLAIEILKEFVWDYKTEKWIPPNVEQMSRRRILFISCRTILDREIYNRLNAALAAANISMRFQFYRDIETDAPRSPEDLCMVNLLVIQVDSLPKLAHAEPYDYCCIDEAESTLEQATNAYLQAPCMEMLQTLIRETPRVILMDANLDETTQILVDSCHRDDFEIIESSFQPWASQGADLPARRAHFYFEGDGIEAAETRIIKDLKAGKRLYVPATSRSTLLALYERLRTKLPSIVTDESSLIFQGAAFLDSQQRKLQSARIDNLNESLRGIAFCGATPLFNAGMNISLGLDACGEPMSREDADSDGAFHKVYCLVEFNSISAKGVMQAVGRTRRLIDDEMHFLFYEGHNHRASLAALDGLKSQTLVSKNDVLKRWQSVAGMLEYFNESKRAGANADDDVPKLHVPLMIPAKNARGEIMDYKQCPSNCFPHIRACLTAERLNRRYCMADDIQMMLTRLGAEVTRVLPNARMEEDEPSGKKEEQERTTVQVKAANIRSEYLQIATATASESDKQIINKSYDDYTVVLNKRQRRYRELDRAINEFDLSPEYVEKCIRQPANRELELRGEADILRETGQWDELVLVTAAIKKLPLPFFKTHNAADLTRVLPYNMLYGRPDCTQSLLGAANLQIEYEATRQGVALDTSTANSLIYLQAVRYSLRALDILGFAKGPLDMHTRVSFVDTSYEAWLTVFDLVIDFVRSFVVSKRKSTLLSLQKHLSVFKSSNAKGKRLVKLPIDMLRVYNARLLEVAFKSSILCDNPAQAQKKKRISDDETVLRLQNKHFKRPDTPASEDNQCILEEEQALANTDGDIDGGELMYMPINVDMRIPVLPKQDDPVDTTPAGCSECNNLDAVFGTLHDNKALCRNCMLATSMNDTSSITNHTPTTPVKDSCTTKRKRNDCGDESISKRVRWYDVSDLDSLSWDQVCDAVDLSIGFDNDE